MKILVTGAKGQLGQELLKLNNNIIGIDIDDFNLLNTFKLNEYIQSIKPDAIIHCAAYTNVDGAESNIELCLNVNAVVVRNLAEICKNIKLVLISTEYVFDGNKSSPYKETDTCNPINVYGKSKYYAEKFMGLCNKGYIVRTSWLYGNGNNFVRAIVNNKANVLNVVDDQIGSPTYAKDLAAFLLKLVETEYYGTYHATNEGYCSRYEFAKEILRVFNIDKEVKPVKSENINSKAIRPKNSMLMKTKMYKHFGRLRDWKEALKEYLNIKE
jgi:dTDP-4-dehydrorhamnose reductase